MADEPMASLSRPSAQVVPNGTRDDRVMDELARAGPGEVAFQGLRRSLGLHPQALVRVLQRLARGGLVERVEGGYRLGPNAPAPPPSLQAEQRTFRPILVGVAPPHLAASDLARRLEGRWFRGLRWYGIRHPENVHELVWTATDSGLAVRVRISGGVVGVEAEVPTSESPVPFHSIAALISALGGYYQQAPRALTLSNAYVPRLAG